MIKSTKVSFQPTKEQSEELLQLSKKFNLSELLRQALSIVLNKVRGAIND